MSVTDITSNSDGTVSFKFWSSPVEKDDYLLLETFDDNASMGGNDGYWKGQGSTKLSTSLEGREGIKQFAGSHCARFGTPSSPSSLTSPELEAVKDAVVTRLAGPWSGEGRLKFASSKRQFLDEVRVQKQETNAIGNIISDNNSLPDTNDGRYLGNDINALGHGMYVVGGKKVVK